jgi:two-component system, LytTR family, sensor histidine kinase AlgZ
MHPILQSRKRLGLYLLAWVLPVLLVASMLAESGKLNWAKSFEVSGALAFFYAIACLSPLYMCRTLPLREPGINRALTHQLAAAFICSLIWTAGAQWLGPLWLRPHLAALYAIGVFLYLISVALHYVYLSVEESKAAVLREQQARVLAREAELRALKAQVNPHFLFNCLNSISALTAFDAVQAREMCILLADFLRNTLRIGEKETIPFREELALVNTYLAVEQVRFGSRLQVDREIDETCAGCSVPPLLLQPLIENSVKHGIASLVEGGTIRVRASCHGGMLRVMVENDFDPESPAPKKSGLGLANVRSRVAARHGATGHVEVTVSDSRHRVDVMIPCQGVSA